MFVSSATDNVPEYALGKCPEIAILPQCRRQQNEEGRMGMVRGLHVNGSTEG